MQRWQERALCFRVEGQLVISRDCCRLLVDRFVLKRLLEDLGFLVVVAGDGQEAVKYYMEHAESITCIWMDINMPIQDGLQATLQIRRIERGRLRRQASRASFVKDLVLVGEGRATVEELRNGYARGKTDDHEQVEWDSGATGWKKTLNWVCSSQLYPYARR
ncbi:g8781 [Coccomyxa viridis]|uniref:histidine kinase n=1 Tax=Coccomyxa viridis TaxID=1274662 RepID=A0ABP1G183_9CHLO